jgi:hypothetical protein
MTTKVKTTRVGVGKSTKRAAFEAGSAAARDALAHLDGVAPDVVLVFGTTGYAQEELLRGVVAVTGVAPMAGCSVEGIITEGATDEGSHVVSVTAIASSRLTLHTFLVADAARAPGAAGEALADLVRGQAGAEGKLLLVFPDGLAINCTAFLDALQERLGSSVGLIAGGGAGCVLDTFRTYQYHGGKVYQDSASAVLLGGDFVADTAISHGCQPLGLERTVTKVDAAYVVEIDGKPAFDVFKEYLDDDIEKLSVADVVHICVGVKLPDSDAEGYSEYLIRAPTTVSPKETGAILFAGQITEGSRIQMTRRDTDHMVHNAVASSRALAARHPGERPLLVFQFDCAGRGRVIFGEQATAMGVRPLQEALGTGLPWVGFYCFGEVAPLHRKTYYHNYTAVLCALYEGRDRA